MIPEHIRRELRYLEISTARAIRTARIGTYTSRARGSGFDFDQHAPYRPGDDVRLIDWNVTARLNAPYRRQTHAERELDLVLAVDVSRSMEVSTGQRSKKEAMTFVTASVLFSAARDQINTGFLAFSDRVLTWSPPARASGRAWQVLEDLWAIESGHRATRLLPAVEHLTTAIKTTSVVVLISDFLTEDSAFESNELRMLASQHDVIAVVVEDPGDTTLPQGRGFIHTRDVETGRALTIALNDRTRRAYANAVASRRQAIVDACYRLRIDYVFVRTDGAIMQPLIELFARRRSA